MVSDVVDSAFYDGLVNEEGWVRWYPIVTSGRCPYYDDDCGAMRPSATFIVRVVNELVRRGGDEEMCDGSY